MTDDIIVQMVNPTGRVINVPSYKKKELERQGFHIIINAKEQYYAQYDKNNRGWNEENITENIPESDYLDVEEL